MECRGSDTVSSNAQQVPRDLRVVDFYGFPPEGRRNDLISSNTQQTNSGPLRQKTPNLPDTDAMETALLANIRALIESARNTVARGVDLVQVHTNFEIGRHMVEFEQQGDPRATFGDALLALLADRLTAEFGKGFGRSNIAYFRSFYLAYRERLPIVQTPSGRLAPQIDTMPFQIVQTASGQSERPFSLSWSHHVFLLGIKNPMNAVFTK